MRFRAASITQLIHNSPYCTVWFSFILWPVWPVWKRFLISFCVELKAYKNLDKLYRNPVYISCALPCPLFSMLSHSILLSFILSHIYSLAKPSPLILSRQVFSLVSVTVPNTAKIYSLSVPLSFPLKKGLFFFNPHASVDDMSIGLQFFTKQTVLSDPTFQIFWVFSGPGRSHLALTLSGKCYHG